MGAGDGAIGGAGRDGDLELARQELEFRVVGGPLANELGDGAGILDLVRRGAGEGIGGDVADGVARGLHRVQADGGEVVHDVGRLAQRDPVELDVLAGGEMAVAAIPALGEIGERAHLAGGKRAIGDRHAQHVGVQLQVEPVHQAKGPEFLFRQRAGEALGHLRAELGAAVGEEGVIEAVRLIHGGAPAGGWACVCRPCGRGAG